MESVDATIARVNFWSRLDAPRLVDRKALLTLKGKTGCSSSTRCAASPGRGPGPVPPQDGGRISRYRASPVQPGGCSFAWGSLNAVRLHSAQASGAGDPGTSPQTL
jgi:hypothetical protein